jgi:hypothetical protein
MSARNGTGVTHQSDADAREIDQLDGPVNFLATPERKYLQPAILAELIGSDRCRAECIIADGSSPVLKLCRLLVQAGFDPDRPLAAYRDGVLALVVASISLGARLEINAKGSGFISRRAVRIGPPVAPTAKCLVQPHKQAIHAAARRAPSS